MSANDDLANPTNPEVPFDLGPEVVACQLLSGVEQLQAHGFVLAWFQYYVLYPVVMLPYLAMMTAMLPFLVFGYSVKEMMGPGYGVVFVLFYLFYWWFFYLRPRGNYFALHANGIRIRMGFKRLHSPFELIQGVFVGREISGVEGGLRNVMSFLKPGQADYLNQLDDKAITIEMTDGTTHVFRAILASFEPDDLEKFFQELVRRHPRFGTYEIDEIGS